MKSILITGGAGYGTLLTEQLIKKIIKLLFMILLVWGFYFKSQKFNKDQR